ncbi:MAG: hypothetical protein JSU73_04830 [candidate division WOR-3 bacterium]|nr:MAG: hypothetical protein JSU73_04830 [candidate division WOR-3 bacterium]
MSRRSPILLLTIVVVGVAVGFGDPGTFVLDTTWSFRKACKDQAYPSLAYDGNCYLAVWRDSRDYPGRVYCARITPAGVLLDSAGIEVCYDAHTGRPVDVAAGDSGFLVVWHDERGVPSYHSNVHCARVSSAGQVLDPDGFIVNDERNYWCSYPRVCFDGANWVVGWRANTDAGGERPAGAYYARVSQAGELLDSVSIQLAQGDTSIGDVGSNGQNTLIVWYGGNHQCFGTRIDSAGRVIDTIPTRITLLEWGAYYPRVATDGSDYLVTWIDHRQRNNVYCARVTSAGELLDSMGIPVTRHGEAYGGTPVEFCGSSYVVAWEDFRGSSPYSDIYCSRVTPHGQVLDQGGIPIATDYEGDYSPAVSSADYEACIVWRDFQVEDHIAGARVDSGGNVLASGYLISGQSGWQQDPCVASDGTDYLAVWTEWLAGYDTAQVWGARVNGSGSVLDPRPFVVCSAAGFIASPRAAGGTSCYLAVWADLRDTSRTEVYAGRIRRDGAVLDPQGIRLSAGGRWARHQELCFVDSTFMVVWHEDNSVVCRPVGQSGTLMDTFLLDTWPTASSSPYPAVGYNGRHCLITWLRFVLEDTAVWASRVTGEGQVLGEPVRVGPVSGSWARRNLGVASDGSSWLVVWDPGGRSGPVGSRIDSAGCLVDTTPIALTNLEWGHSPSVCFDGTEYVVAWQEDAWPGRERDLVGVRVSPAGAVSDTFLVSDQYGSQYTPSLAHGSGEQVMVVYSGFAREVNGRPANSRRIWGEQTPFLGIVARREPVASRRCSAATVARRQLHVPHRRAADLIDITGRRVMDLEPGENDIRHVAPGVYFCRPTAGSASSRSAESGWRSAVSVRKVVIQR